MNEKTDKIRNGIFLRNLDKIINNDSLTDKEKISKIEYWKKETEKDLKNLKDIEKNKNRETILGISKEMASEIDWITYGGGIYYSSNILDFMEKYEYHNLPKILQDFCDKDVYNLNYCLAYAIAIETGADIIKVVENE